VDQIEGKMKPNTVEWELARKEGIGASDAPIILGLSPWKTRRQLFEEKTSETLSVPTYPMLWGKRWEATALDIFVENTGFKVAYDTDECFVWSNERPWQFATFDGLIDNGSFVEIKCPLSIKSHQMAVNDTIPEHYLAQMQHQFCLRDCDKAYYISLFIDKRNGYEYDARILEVYRDEDYIKRIIEEEEIFLDHLISNTPPN